jgi:ferritin-like metal-binding protein YciE
MSHSTQKVIQHLEKAHASEVSLVRVLQSQIATTPSGRYRVSLEKHLLETRDHAERVHGRLGELGHAANPLKAGVGLVENVITQALGAGKAPLDAVRGTGSEEKVLKQAKDAAATEALEIATYTAIERLANSLGDTETARLAASIRHSEERMLSSILSEIPRLAEAVAAAELHGDGRRAALSAVRSRGTTH